MLWVVWACRCLENTNTAQIGLRKAGLDADYILRAGAEHLLLIFSSRTRWRWECRAPGNGDMSAPRRTGRKLSRHQTPDMRRPGLCGKRLFVFNEHVLIYQDFWYAFVFCYKRLLKVFNMNQLDHTSSISYYYSILFKAFISRGPILTGKLEKYIWKISYFLKTFPDVGIWNRAWQFDLEPGFLFNICVDSDTCPTKPNQSICI